MHRFSPTKMQRLRFERGLSREALAQATGVHYWSIQAWERGKHVPRGMSVAALARALGVAYDDLLEEQRPAAAAATGRVQEIHATAATRGDSDAVR
ncbi:MAG TPA: helix-turn-helix transcriptional regulator [Gaiellaceae bacterium]|nr:helix-turn-helix transcriptional regulator [Gaiellaceae bacterium]